MAGTKHTARGFYPGATVEDEWVLSSAALAEIFEASREYGRTLQWVAMLHAFERNSRDSTGSLYRCAIEDVQSAKRELASINNDLLEACQAAIEATGGSANWKGETEKFLKLCEAAVAKAEST